MKVCGCGAPSGHDKAPQCTQTGVDVIDGSFQLLYLRRTNSQDRARRLPFLLRQTEVGTEVKEVILD